MSREKRKKTLFFVVIAASWVFVPGEAVSSFFLGFQHNHNNTEEAFDFRDENNEPVQGDQKRIEALFAESAFRLLVLGETPPKILARSLTASLIPWLGKLGVKALREAGPFFAAIAESLRGLRRMLPRHSAWALAPPPQAVFNHKKLFSPACLSFRGAPVPLRL